MTISDYIRICEIEKLFMQTFGDKIYITKNLFSVNGLIYCIIKVPSKFKTSIYLDTEFRTVLPSDDGAEGYTLREMLSLYYDKSLVNNFLFKLKLMWEI